MAEFAEPLARLIQECKRLPGIGQKSAQRIAFHLLRTPREDAENLAQAILDIKDKLGVCENCNNISDGELCLFCRDPHREQAQICVVEEPHNILPIETTRAFRGLYHVLHGAISPLRGIGPEQLRIKGLVDRLHQNRDRRSHPCDESHCRRRSDGRLSLALAQTSGAARHAHRHGHPGGQRPGICRRSDHVTLARKPARHVGAASTLKSKCWSRFLLSRRGPNGSVRRRPLAGTTAS